VKQTLAATEPASLSVIQVRRLGSARLRCTQGGLPVTGLRVDVVSRESGEHVSAWVAAQLAALQPASGETDAEGWLVVEGVPHGAYAWSVTLPEDGPFEGEFSVLPGTRVDVEIQIP
jgi:hypothetical protein